MSEYDANIGVKIGSEKNFGIVIAAVLGLIAVWPVFFGNDLRWYLAIPAIILIVLAFVRPRTLTKPNQLWFRFGMFLGGIVAPVIMALVFITAFLPIGSLLRLIGKDLLREKIEPDAESYWLDRADTPQSMKKQF